MVTIVIAGVIGMMSEQKAEVFIIGTGIKKGMILKSILLVLIIRE